MDKPRCENKTIVTTAQAATAVEIVLHLAECAGGPCELTLAYPATQQILDLAAEIKGNEGGA